ncbi:MAG: leucine-rich repeat domain-containing protein [bacterium]|nr:leucine-rich repeat domain-containing protein [bacterium]
MKKQYKKALAAVLAVSMAWNLIPNIPYAHASRTPHYIVDDIETLPDDIMYQQVEFGTKETELELPDELLMLVRPDNEEDWNIEYIETASPSNADRAEEKSETVTPSGAERTDEDEDETATPSTATSSNAEDTDGDWRMVRVEWVLNERFSEAAEYDGEQPGIYVFDAEFANDRYSVGDALLPTIEVEVLEEVQEQPVQRAPLAIQEQAVGGMATITAFAELSDEVKAQELAIGASETEITLPNTLGVILALQTEDSVDGGTGDEINVGLTGIEWKIDEKKSSTAEFSSDESASGNKYVYVPVLPETTELKNDNGEMQVYTLALDTNLELPEITVTIAWVADKYGTPMDGGITGDCEWKVYDTNNNHTADLLVVSGEGRTGSYKGYDRPWESYKDTITSLIVEDGVEYIDQRAFWSMTALENIKLAGSVQGMDYMAFCLCGSLKRLVLPEGLTYIGAVAFSGCENLTYAELPDTLDKIDNWAFDGCVSLETLIIPKNVASIGTEVFDEGTTVYNLSEAELTSDMLGGAKEGNVYKITLSDGSGEEQIQKVLTSEIAAGTRYEGTEYNAASYFADGDGNAWFVLDEESGFYSEVTAENEAEVLSANPVLYKAKTMSWNGINAAAEYTGRR